MYLIMEAVICYVSDNAGSNMLKKTLSWVMVGMLFLSLIFNENLGLGTQPETSEEMGTLMALGVYLH